MMFATYRSINTEDYLLDKLNNNTIFSDYYISNGINLNQVSGLRAFSKRLKIFVVILLIIIILYNIYRFIYNKNNNNEINNSNNIQKVKTNDESHLNAVIAAAIAAYEEDKNSVYNNKIYVKTIKKTNWKKHN